MKDFALRGFLLAILALSCLLSACSENNTPSTRIPVIFDTDANNEVDDQHALAYLLLNQGIFDIKAITVNATFNGGNIDLQYEEALRILQLTDPGSDIPLLKGANSAMDSIQDIEDGEQAIDKIISEAKSVEKGKLTILAVGKLTNVALAVRHAPEIAGKIRLVWLGSNYPEPGEYNLENDIPAMNYLLDTEVEFEMVTVRYGKDSGTDAVRVTKEEINQMMPGKGPIATAPVTGRHGGSFMNFGDYSVDLFDHIDYYGDPPSRALFDMAAVAIVKNPTWAQTREMPAPIMEGKMWVDRPDNSRVITLWEYFDSEAIKNDFYSSFQLP